MEASTQRHSSLGPAAKSRQRRHTRDRCRRSSNGSCAPMRASRSGGRSSRWAGEAAAMAAGLRGRGGRTGAGSSGGGGEDSGQGCAGRLACLIARSRTSGVFARPQHSKGTILRPLGTTQSRRGDEGQSRPIAIASTACRARAAGPRPSLCSHGAPMLWCSLMRGLHSRLRQSAPSMELWEAVHQALEAHQGPAVLDGVGSAFSGPQLPQLVRGSVNLDTRKCMISRRGPRASLTPAAAAVACRSRSPPACSSRPLAMRLAPHPVAHQSAPCS